MTVKIFWALLCLAVSATTSFAESGRSDCQEETKRSEKRQYGLSGGFDIGLIKKDLAKSIAVSGPKKAKDSHGFYYNNGGWVLEGNINQLFINFQKNKNALSFLKENSGNLFYDAVSNTINKEARPNGRPVVKNISSVVVDYSRSGSKLSASVFYESDISDELDGKYFIYSVKELWTFHFYNDKWFLVGITQIPGY